MSSRVRRVSARSLPRVSVLGPSALGCAHAVAEATTELWRATAETLERKLEVVMQAAADSHSQMRLARAAAASALQRERDAKLLEVSAQRRLAACLCRLREVELRAESAEASLSSSPTVVRELIRTRAGVGTSSGVLPPPPPTPDGVAEGVGYGTPSSVPAETPVAPASPVAASPTSAEVSRRFPAAQPLWDALPGVARTPAMPRSVLQCVNEVSTVVVSVAAAAAAQRKRTSRDAGCLTDIRGITGRRHLTRLPSPTAARQRDGLQRDDGAEDGSGLAPPPALPHTLIPSAEPVTGVCSSCGALTAPAPKKAGKQPPPSPPLTPRQPVPVTPPAPTAQSTASIQPAASSPLSGGHAGRQESAAKTSAPVSPTAPTASPNVQSPSPTSVRTTSPASVRRTARDSPSAARRAAAEDPVSALLDLWEPTGADQVASWQTGDVAPTELPDRTAAALCAAVAGGLAAVAGSQRRSGAARPRRVSRPPADKAARPSTDKATRPIQARRGRPPLKRIIPSPASGAAAAERLRELTSPPPRRPQTTQPLRRPLAISAAHAEGLPNLREKLPTWAVSEAPEAELVLGDAVAGSFAANCVRTVTWAASASSAVAQVLWAAAFNTAAPPGVVAQCAADMALAVSEQMLRQIARVRARVVCRYVFVSCSLRRLRRAQRRRQLDDADAPTIPVRGGSQKRACTVLAVAAENQLLRRRFRDFDRLAAARKEAALARHRLLSGGHPPSRPHRLLRFPTPADAPPAVPVVPPRCLPAGAGTRRLLQEHNVRVAKLSVAQLPKIAAV
eukprot:TRINITY_DN4356_c0_g1_i1.p1 TRINITY_DN4356_c0_g1~~TRINITY_DN4356_c0_g1_i1.p1  ORF type:complete len:791 (+),score=209.88 TRINITY_DN4356_c0_g1_i1:1011-3383(+)